MREMYCICTSEIPKIGTVTVLFEYIIIKFKEKYMKYTNMVPE